MSSTLRKLSFEDLPNEIILSILSRFSTLALLPLTTTSRRIHSLILRLLQTRLLSACFFSDHQLIFECFHPATKLSTPYLICELLGSYPLPSPPLDAKGKDVDGELSLKGLRNLYSHFKPLKPTTDHRTPRAHPAGGWLVMPPHYNALVNEDDTDLVCQNIHLESHELFSQLCTTSNLVKLGPRRGLYASCVNVGKGFMRVWRGWLKDGCEKEEGVLMWTDVKEDVGLRMRVEDRSVEVAGGRAGEDPPVSYCLQYEELVVRTSQLLFKVEETIEREQNESGKAIVIGSWDP